MTVLNVFGPRRCGMIMQVNLIFIIYCQLQKGCFRYTVIIVLPAELPRLLLLCLSQSERCYKKLPWTVMDYPVVEQPQSKHTQQWAAFHDGFCKRREYSEQCDYTRCYHGMNIALLWCSILSYTFYYFVKYDIIPSHLFLVTSLKYLAG